MAKNAEITPALRAEVRNAEADFARKINAADPTEAGNGKCRIARGVN
jgi:hypothetical protein